MTTSKTGKHGHAKAHIICIDIFTGKKYEVHEPSTHNVEVPVVSKAEYDLIDITDEGKITFLKEDGTYDESLSMKTDSELFKKIFAEFNDDKNILISVTSAVGQKHVTGRRLE